MSMRKFPLEREINGARINIALRETTRKRHGNRVIIFGAGTFVELQKAAESILGGEASAVFYESGIQSGREAAESFLIEFDERDEELLEIIDEDWGSNGFGWFKLIESNYDLENKSGYLKVSDSFIATVYGRSGKKVCDFISGFLAGMYGALLKTEIMCTEIKCWSNGDKYCEFNLEAV